MTITMSADLCLSKRQQTIGPQGVGIGVNGTTLEDLAGHKQLSNRR